MSTLFLSTYTSKYLFFFNLILCVSLKLMGLMKTNPDSGDLKLFLLQRLVNLEPEAFNPALCLPVTWKHSLPLCTFFSTPLCKPSRGAAGKVNNKQYTINNLSLIRKTVCLPMSLLWGCTHNRDFLLWSTWSHSSDFCEVTLCT